MVSSLKEGKKETGRRRGVQDVLLTSVLLMLVMSVSWSPTEPFAA